MKDIEVLGVPIHAVTAKQACETAEQLIRGGGAHQLATVNPEFIMAAQRDPEFMQVLHRTALNVPDGVGVLWAARRLGRVLPERVAGVELMDELCAMASTHGWRAFFLGAQLGVAERAAAAMALRYPGLIICGTYAGSPRPDDDAETTERVRAAHPNLVFVAYGAPAQDKWFARNAPAISTGPRPQGDGLLGMGVGGAFDFVAGVQQRAPEWVRSIGFEWLYRLVRQPWRIRRQTALIRFARAVMLESRRKPAF